MCWFIMTHWIIPGQAIYHHYVWDFPRNRDHCLFLQKRKQDSSIFKHVSKYLLEEINKISGYSPCGWNSYFGTKAFNECSRESYLTFTRTMFRLVLQQKLPLGNMLHKDQIWNKDTHLELPKHLNSQNSWTCVVQCVNKKFYKGDVRANM